MIIRKEDQCKLSWIYNIWDKVLLKKAFKIFFNLDTFTGPLHINMYTFDQNAFTLGNIHCITWTNELDRYLQLHI